ncbi:MAG: phosphodiester glycosidase family protein [Rhabdochlamydiaceae bacterium]|nr:phosphodiester glycosidase family protein [Candidatus Amphrikana amoebophyrae]
MNNLATLFLICSLSFLHPFLKANDYIQYQTYSSPNPKRKVHHFKVNPRRINIEIVNGTDNCVGIERVSDIAKRKGAILAINGGYFQGGSLLGAPDGPMKINSLLCGYRSGETGALGYIKGERSAHIDRIKMDVKLFCRGHTFPIDAINRNLYDNTNVLYTHNFNSTTLTTDSGKSFQITNVIKPSFNSGGHTIPHGGYVFAQGKNVHPKVPLFLMNRPVQIRASLRPILNPERINQWKGFENIINGVVILSNFSTIRDYHKEGVSNTITKNKHARTAIGLDDNGWWHIVIVEAKHQGNIGMTMDELGDLMKKLGCRFALSLDGGGSSTFYYKGNTKQFLTHKEHSFMQSNVYYHPEGGERPVGNAIVFKPK